MFPSPAPTVPASILAFRVTPSFPKMAEPNSNKRSSRRNRHEPDQDLASGRSSQKKPRLHQDLDQTAKSLVTRVRSNTASLSSASSAMWDALSNCTSDSGRDDAQPGFWIAAVDETLRGFLDKSRPAASPTSIVRVADARLKHMKDNLKHVEEKAERLEAAKAKAEKLLKKERERAEKMLTEERERTKKLLTEERERAERRLKEDQKTAKKLLKSAQALVIEKEARLKEKDQLLREIKLSKSELGVQHLWFT